MSGIEFDSEHFRFHGFEHEVLSGNTRNLSGSTWQMSGKSRSVIIQTSEMRLSGNASMSGIQDQQCSEVPGISMRVCMCINKNTYTVIYITCVIICVSFLCFLDSYWGYHLVALSLDNSGFDEDS